MKFKRIPVIKKRAFDCDEINIFVGYQCTNFTMRI